MSLINVQVIEPVVLSTKDKQKLTKTALVQLSSYAFEQLKLFYQRGHDWVNANPHGLTKDEVLAGLGEEDAKELARLADLLKTAVNGAIPGTIPDEAE